MKIVFTPDWFLNNDVLIETFSFLILVLFFLFAIKSYKLSEKKNVLYLGIGFLLIALAELASIVTKFILYYDFNVTQEIGQAIITYKIVSSVDIFYYLGFFFQRFFTMLGFYVIYKTRTATKGEFLFTVYLLFAIAALSQPFYYVYHITSLMLLGLIINNYYKVYKEDKVANTRVLLFAFSLLALSQIIFIFSKLGLVYVLAQNIQLISYAILLVLIVKIIKNGPKEKQSRNNP
ncbi:MAG: hypothetical protein ABIH49_01825 [archaeon]